MSELQQLCIMVTRPNPAGEELCQRIRQQGGEAIHFPTIAILPPRDINAFQQNLSILGIQDWLIFISPQAVYASMTEIRRAWPHLPSHVQFAAVGEGTAHALREAGYLVSAYPKNTWSAESLLNLPEFQNVNGKKITIIRGEEGREVLEKSLNIRGAIVNHLIAYHRGLPQTKTDQYLSLLKQNKIDVIVCASFTAVQHLKILLDESYLNTIPLIVVSDRIKKLAQDLGFQTIWIASNASHDAILDVLKQKKAILKNRRNQ